MLENGFQEWSHTLPPVFWLMLALLLLNAVLLIWLLLRRPRRPADVPARGELADLLAPALERAMSAQGRALERGLRAEMNEGNRSSRQELGQAFASFQDTVTRQSAEATRTQNLQIDAFAKQLVELRTAMLQTLTAQLESLTESNTRRMREVRGTLEQQLLQLQAANTGKIEEMNKGNQAGRTELQAALTAFRESMGRQSAEAARTQNAQMEGFAKQISELRTGLAEVLSTRLEALSEGNAKRMREVRATLEQQLAQMQAGNERKLEEMRKTVDEKLHATLEQRLGESFKQVADRLEQVHKGLGEMQNLAQGVGDLKHLLSNVSTRGNFGEVQLDRLLAQVLAPEQYEKQKVTRPDTRNPVDFAIRLPGREPGDAVWLPIDAKFPTEDYERLLQAQQQADPVAAEAAARALESRVRQEARSIHEKYVEPPHTTNFAILFLPSEGLYAEVLRRPGLVEALQRRYRITLAGPTTLLAMLNSLQMGFRTLALQKRSSEVWEVLSAVKTEFGKFGDVLAKVKKQTRTVLNTLEESERRTRVMNRRLRTVDALPEAQARTLLPELEAGEATTADEGDTD